MEVRNGDEFLWTGFRNGDRLCLEMLVKKHYALLYDYGKKFTGDQELVKDAIQELFLVLWKNRATIGETQSVRNYLFKALRRKIERLLNAKKEPRPFRSSLNISSPPTWNHLNFYKRCAKRTMRDPPLFSASWVHFPAASRKLFISGFTWKPTMMRSPGSWGLAGRRYITCFIFPSPG